MKTVKWLLLCCCSCSLLGAEMPDRFVWVFGWGLEKEADVAAITRVLETAAQNGLNGAVLSANLDTLCKKTPAFFKNLEAVKQVCEKNHLELIPAVFSIGYGGGYLSHNRQLAEGLPVVAAPFEVQGGEARLVAGAGNLFVNAGFEEFAKNKFKGFNFHDQPGEVSFCDTEVKHSGQSSLRMENFTSNPHGHGRVMQSVKVTPHRCYRLSVWLKTENLRPTQGFGLKVLAGKQELSPRSFPLEPTHDWQPLTSLVNSGDFDTINIYAGMWEGREGKLWLDDWRLEEVGPVKVLRRPGTPVTVQNEERTITYVEGKDYAPLAPEASSPYQVPQSAGAALKILPGGQIKNGQKLRVSWYHSMLINDSQVTVCMGEPEIYEIVEHEVKLLAEHLQPKRVMLNMDEVRMGGTCAACAGKDMGKLLGECLTKHVQIVQRHLPGTKVYVWSDMLDPNHNAHGNYYLVKGDFTGSWQHVPKDMVIAVWGGKPAEKSLRFFAEQGFETLGACYYDAPNLDQVRGWAELRGQIPKMRGLMYTPWQKKYELLPGFGKLCREK